jgi:hypothetical protein
MDIAQAGHPAGDVLALHVGPGPAPPARIPDAYFAAAAPTLQFRRIRCAAPYARMAPSFPRGSRPIGTCRPRVRPVRS